ncbi:hypothetical protein EIP86_005788 [Pleurotus ostreatoroseus]|nr:hypothetical protein EIP86_005788 [Pleurotus ostreatoroseus]
MLADNEFRDDGSSISSYGQLIKPTIGRTGSPTARSSSHGSPETLDSQLSVQAPSLQPTIDEVRERAISSICFGAVRRAETVDGTRVGLIQTMSPSSDPDFLSDIATTLHKHFPTASYLFAICPSSSLPGVSSPLLVCGASAELVTHAETLIGSKFVGRIIGRGRTHSGGRRWFTLVRDLGTTSYDHAALNATIRQAARAPIDPAQVTVPPPGSLGSAQMLARARARLERLSPQAAYAELRDPVTQWPVVLVDIRPQSVRDKEGTISGSIVVERNELEWRFDPRLPESKRLPVANRYDLRVILFCTDGTASSLAAASLRDLGLLTATDIVGGYNAWQVAGLPSEVEVLANGISLESLR